MGIWSLMVAQRALPYKGDCARVHRMRTAVVSRASSPQRNCGSTRLISVSMCSPNAVVLLAEVSCNFVLHSLRRFNRGSIVEGRGGAWSKTVAYACERGYQHCHGYRSKLLQVWWSSGRKFGKVSSWSADSWHQFQPDPQWWCMKGIPVRLQKLLPLPVPLACFRLLGSSVYCTAVRPEKKSKS